MKGHCIQNCLWKGIVHKIFFERPLYKEFSLKGCCIQKNSVKGRYIQKISLTGCCMQNFLWQAVLYNIFFEKTVYTKFSLNGSLYTTFSLKGRCIQNFLWKGVVLKKIDICPFSRCLSRYSTCRKSRSFQEIFLG